MNKPQRHVKYSTWDKIKLGILATIASVGIGIWIAYIIDIIVNVLK